METIALTVNVPLGDLSPETVREAVIVAAVERVLGIVHYNDEDEDGRPVRRTDNRAYDEMRRTVQSLVEKRILATVEAEVPRVVSETLQAPFVPTNRYGERRGEPITLREMIADHAKTWLTENVNERGGSDFYREQAAPRVHWLIRKDVETAFKATIAEETNKIAAEIKAQMSGRINAAIADVVNRIVGAK